MDPKNKPATGRKNPDSVVTERVALCLRYVCAYLPIPKIIELVKAAGYLESDRQIREDIKKAERMFAELTTNNINIEDLRSKRVRQYEELIATQYASGDLKEVRLLFATLDELQGLKGAKAGTFIQNNTLVQNGVDWSKIPLEKKQDMLRAIESSQRATELENELEIIEIPSPGANE